MNVIPVNNPNMAIGLTARFRYRSSDLGSNRIGCKMDMPFPMVAVSNVKACQYTSVTTIAMPADMSTEKNKCRQKSRSMIAVLNMDVTTNCQELYFNKLHEI